ncbi:hypothetical protein JCM21714_1902 [Gracilibacillus boraciitolerans JCM 21714]|uniref:DUF86 domain-containing protein n=1 Tax=Gracilibacillus boraciitolerans JCM 21714 TaxID=1298598 RepID=W4VHK7_9BACI|nr:DUF86 domain-containing protein [Gracilibacillus boraciitolerans]GAE92880.1 hypothetical protein JCM21714_1902 [Gracilibacillus boraciitolerans JCM 21714]
MYFVDMKKMNERLDFFDDMLSLTTENQFQTKLELLALERITHVIIESLLDVGNMMIDGFIMRDPGSYLDIVHILVDEKVLPEDDKSAYEAIINVRKELVHEYSQLDHQRLLNTIEKHYPVLSLFTENIRSYLANEMGVANTFTNPE